MKCLRFREQHTPYQYFENELPNIIKKAHSQYGKVNAATPIRTYEFVGVFPVDLSEITLDWGDNDTIEEFTVTFAYQYWRVA